MKKRFSLKEFILKHKKGLIILSILLLLLIGFGIYVFIGVRSTQKNISVLKADLDAVKLAEHNKSIVGITAGLEKIQLDIKPLQSNLKYFGFVQYVPIARGYYLNTDYALSAAGDIDNALIEISKSSVPLANALGYGGVPIKGQARVQVIVSKLADITNTINTQSGTLRDAQKNIDNMDPNYIPDISIKGVNLKTSFVTYKNEYNSFLDLLPKLNTIVPAIQTALGVPDSKNYLLLLENDNEIRATGGFITSYGILNFNNGAMGNITTNDIYNLDKLEVPYLNAPIQLKQYVEVVDWYMRDSNYSPDAPTSAKVAEEMYRTIPRRDVPPIDGVIFLNTKFVASLLDAIGPVYIPSYNVTVNSSNADYLIEYYSEKLDNNSNTANRKEFINYLIEQIKAKVFSAQGNNLVKLMQIGYNDVLERNIMMYSDDANVESVINEYNFGGKFPTPTQNDFLGFVDTNVLGQKSDFYIKRNIDATIQTTSKGELETVKMTFSNDHIYDGWLNKASKKWVRLYVPLGSQLVSISGDDQYYRGLPTRRVYDELGYSVIDTHITVPVKYHTSDPTASVTLTYSYYLPKAFTSSSHYATTVYKQGGIGDLQTTITYNGKKQSADITKDTTFTF